MSRPALVSNDRKLGYLGQIGSLATPYLPIAIRIVPSSANARTPRAASANPSITRRFSFRFAALMPTGNMPITFKVSNSSLLSGSGVNRPRSFASRETTNAGVRQSEDTKSPQRVIQRDKPLPMKLRNILLQIAFAELAQRRQLFGAQRWKGRISHCVTMGFSHVTTSLIDLRQPSQLELLRQPLARTGHRAQFNASSRP